jgi:choline dehydrogenase
VILSAGAIGSPRILQLSGVGDPEHLAKIGVPVVHELRGVRKNMQGHYVARVSYPVVGPQTANERSRGLPLAGEVMRWLFTGKGMLTYSPSIVAASVKVLEESATPDVQCTLAPGSFKGGQIGELEETPGLSAGAWQMRPLSRGYVEAKSNRPGDMPAINPRYLSEESDRGITVTAYLSLWSRDRRKNSVSDRQAVTVIAVAIRSITIDDFHDVLLHSRGATWRRLLRCHSTKASST